MAVYFAPTPPSLPTAGDQWINATAAKFGDIQVFDGAVWKESTAIAAAGTLTGTTLAANVITSSLTSFGVTVPLLNLVQTFTATQTMTAGLTLAGLTAGATLTVNGTATLTNNSNKLDTDLTPTYVTTASGTTPVITPLYAIAQGTATAGVTVTRWASAYFDGGAITVGGTLTNNDTMYLTTPTNGATVKVIDTNAGGGTPANLTTSGSWTNASSWKATKTDLGEAAPATVQGWLSALAAMPQPHFYRYPTIRCDRAGQRCDLAGTDEHPDDCDVCHPVGCEVCRGGHQDWEYDDLFHFLDDMPEDMRRVICSEEGGAISTKSTDGFLLACVQELSRKVTALEAA